MHGHHWHGYKSLLQFHNHGHLLKSRSLTSSNRVIILAVCCSVGGCILGFVIWRIITACRSPSAPLPPIQPLAHHRQQYQHVEDKHDWDYEKGPMNLTAGRTAVFHAAEGSNSTLLPSGYLSSRADETSESLLLSPVDLPSSSSNQISHDSRFPRNGRDSSPLGLRDTSITRKIALHTPLPAASSSSLIRIPSDQPHDSHHSHNRNPSLTTQRSRVPSSRSRQLSLISTASTNYLSKSSRNVIRGTPHGPHSNVQVVLPTLLAPHLSPYHGVGNKLESNENVDLRTSYVDKWATSPTKSYHSRSGGGTPSSSSSRESIAKLNSNRSPSVPRYNSTSPSPVASRDRHASSFPRHQFVDPVPPVPPVPSQTTTHAFPPSQSDPLSSSQESLDRS